MFPSTNNSSGRFSQDNYEFDNILSGSPEVYTKPMNIQEPATSPHLDTYGMGPSSSPSWMRQGQESYSGKENQLFHEPHNAIHFYRTATHQNLIQAGNRVYGKLYDSHIALQGRYNELRSSYSQLTESMKSRSQESSHPPGSTVSQAFRIPLSAKFDTADYPMVKFPTRDRYNAFLKAKRSARAVLDPTADSDAGSGKSQRGGHRLAVFNENVATDYVEKVDGTIVPGDTAKNIRDHARAVILEMENHSSGLPQNWGLASVNQRKFFIKEMYDKFPYLWLCCDDWKVLYLAGHTLSTYRQRILRQNSAGSKHDRDSKPNIIIKSESIKTEPIDYDRHGNREYNSNTSGPSFSRDDDDSDDDIYMPLSIIPKTQHSKSIPSLNQKRKVESGMAQASSKRARHIVYDLTGEGSDTEDVQVVKVLVRVPEHPKAQQVAPLKMPLERPDRFNLNVSNPIKSTSPIPVRPSTTMATETALSSVQPIPPPTLDTSHRLEARQHESSPLSDTDSILQPPPDPTSQELAPALSDPVPRPLASVESTMPPPLSISVENPFASLFGPAVAPTGRLESLKEVAEGKGSTTKEKGGEANAAYVVARSKTFGPKAKKVTNSSSAKNLYYIDYLQSNDPITPTEFEEIWNALAKDVIKKYNQLSKIQK
ncbi:hypothetical protein HYPSUDRAFT_209259 [Hypholoma sublateritium FD-334 SS-4]|uniref:Uncharacterized protein n=1 Tax=Hypholoma sublateritium (strain FD-334 SS-4) TaxID=945553 RepID=A0A0D2LSI5_HYPSF|nr:hypothetical protein HYPSUDRAFT_209259 [Hypholoma sublateritium FD-334 SS-4]